MLRMVSFDRWLAFERDSVSVREGARLGMPRDSEPPWLSISPLSSNGLHCADSFLFFSLASVLSATRRLRIARVPLFHSPHCAISSPALPLQVCCNDLPLSVFHVRFQPSPRIGAAFLVSSQPIASHRRVLAPRFVSRRPCTAALAISPSAPMRRIISKLPRFSTLVAVFASLLLRSFGAASLLHTSRLDTQHALCTSVGTTTGTSSHWRSVAVAVAPGARSISPCSHTLRLFVCFPFPAFIGRHMARGGVDQRKNATYSMSPPPQWQGTRSERRAAERETCHGVSLGDQIVHLGVERGEVVSQRDGHLQSGMCIRDLADVDGRLYRRGRYKSHVGCALCCLHGEHEMKRCDGEKRHTWDHRNEGRRRLDRCEGALRVPVERSFAFAIFRLASALSRRSDPVHLRARARGAVEGVGPSENSSARRSAPRWRRRVFRNARRGAALASRVRAGPCCCVPRGSSFPPRREARDAVAVAMGSGPAIKEEFGPAGHKVRSVRCRFNCMSGSELAKSAQGWRSTLGVRGGGEARGRGSGLGTAGDLQVAREGDAGEGEWGTLGCVVRVLMRCLFLPSPRRDLVAARARARAPLRFKMRTRVPRLAARWSWSERGSLTRALRSWRLGRS